MTKMSLSRWMDELVHPDNERTKNEWTIKPRKTWKNLRCVLLRKRSQPEKATYYIIPTIWPFGKGKTTETIKTSVLPGWGRAGGKWKEEGIFRAVKWYDTTTVGKCHYTSVKSHRRTNLLWTMNLGWQRVIVGVSTVTNVLLWWGVLTGKAVLVGQGSKGYMGTHSTFHSVLLWT